MMNCRPEPDFFSINILASVFSLVHHSSFIVHHFRLMALYSVKLKAELVVQQRQTRLAPCEGEVGAAQGRQSARGALDAVLGAGEVMMQSRVQAQRRAILDGFFGRA